MSALTQIRPDPGTLTPRQPRALLWLPGAAASTGLLREAAEHCLKRGAQISLLATLPERPGASGCCGIGDEHFSLLLEHQAREHLQQASRDLARLGCPSGHAQLSTDPDEVEVIAAIAKLWRCDTVLVPAQKTGRFSVGRRRVPVAARMAEHVDVVQLRSPA